VEGEKRIQGRKKRTSRYHRESKAHEETTSTTGLQLRARKQTNQALHEKIDRELEVKRNDRFFASCILRGKNRNHKSSLVRRLGGRGKKSIERSILRHGYRRRRTGPGEIGKTKHIREKWVIRHLVVQTLQTLAIKEERKHCSYDGEILKVTTKTQ